MALKKGETKGLNCTRKKIESVIYQIPSFTIFFRFWIQQNKLFRLAFYRNGGGINGLLFRFSFFSQGNEKDNGRFIDNTLHQYDCSKMKLFCMAYDFERDPNFTSKILFATRRNVEELFLFSYRPISKKAYMLPKSVFDNVSLVKLQFLHCEFQLSSRVNLPSLKVLNIGCYHLKDSKSIEFILSGSPSLESLEIKYVTSTNPVIIASKSLTTLSFQDVTITHDLEISCPNLERLLVKGFKPDDPSIFPSKTVLNVLSGSPLLHYLELMFCDLKDLVIASKSLKTLVIGWVSNSAIEVSCPNLKRLVCFGPVLEKCKLRNLPSSCCASLDFAFGKGSEKILARKILVELQHVKDLQVFDWFVEILSALKTERLSNPLLNVKCLTLGSLSFKNALGIVNALGCSPSLERLVIKLEVHEFQEAADLDFKIFEESFWISKGVVFTCLVSHLKTVEIIGLTKKDGKYEVILRFIEFLLETARVLEKMSVIVQDGGRSFRAEVSRKLSGFPRCSQHAIVELL